MVAGSCLTTRKIVSCAISYYGRLMYRLLDRLPTNAQVSPTHLRTLVSTGACGVSTAAAMLWVEEKLHASDLIRQLSGVDDAETKSVDQCPPIVSVALSTFPQSCVRVIPVDRLTLFVLHTCAFGKRFAAISYRLKVGAAGPGQGISTGESSRHNPASPSFWGKRSSAQPTPELESSESSEPIVEAATLGGRTPKSLAEDLWEEQPLIKDGMMAKVR